jgi:hypothetical protein
VKRGTTAAARNAATGKGYEPLILAVLTALFDTT